MENSYTKNKKIVWILAAIILAGLFLRVWRHDDLTRFNPDQSRDAALVRGVVEDGEAWPLLGPKAGGTEFRLGPAFYWFEIISAKIFKNLPADISYPDLLFSILTIPLLYFFLRKYFDKNISLAATAVFAVSFYAVKYARFAWNPNSTPFFVILFLYALLEISDPGQKRKWPWALALGMSAGIGVQLHSLLLFSFPIVFVLYFAWLFFRKNPSWKFAPLIVLTGLALNTPQIVNEIRTGGDNIQAFMKGAENKSSREGSLPQKFILDGVCHIQAGSFMILPVGNNDQCDFMEAGKIIKKNGLLVLDILFAAVFSLGGCALLFYYWKREEDENKKRFLEIITLYAGIFFVILVPLAAEISFRFFLVLEFMPFFFLALWLKLLTQNKDKTRDLARYPVVAIIVATIVATNTVIVNNQLAYLAGNREEGISGFEEITLGEVKYMVDFIQTNSDAQKDVYIDGKAGDLFKIKKPIEYFTAPTGTNLHDIKKDLKPGDKLFRVDISSSPDKNAELPEKFEDDYEIIFSGQKGRVSIYELEKK